MLGSNLSGRGGMFSSSYWGRGGMFDCNKWGKEGMFGYREIQSRVWPRKEWARKFENEDAKKTTLYSRVPDFGLIKSTKYAGSKKKRKDKKPSLKSSEE